MDAVELQFQAFRAAGADDGSVYLSVPITSGQRELKLMAALRCSSDQLRSDHREQWVADVLRPNEENAAGYARRLREMLPHQLVINPAELNVPGWSQHDYAGFWEAFVERFAARVVLAPGWEFSRGARAEVRLAIRLSLPILDMNGSALTTTSLHDSDTAARNWITRVGFSKDSIEGYLIDLGLSSGEVGFGKDDAEMLDNQAAAEVFAWLRGERAYQLGKFGIESDDKHTRIGLGEESWWWRQLTNYYHRASVLGLNTPVGRQALAKFVATACGLLESAVRLYGPLPRPGVPSGDNLDSTVT